MFAIQSLKASFYYAKSVPFLIHLIYSFSNCGFNSFRRETYLFYIFILDEETHALNTDLSFLSSRRNRGSNMVQQCPYCPYSTTAKGRLRDHILTHTGEKPHPCPHCGRCFAQKSTMRRHAVKHCV